ncbi:serine acetyltransferase 2 [Selaginella moellendorffii]|uniref:serine acetyltransferase 2 n=1 Tax=Selaginella moellendorffii TaxID=88036 RepID=UPI000D1C5312|nr:serine acetyltransferase 2 [Selaginella moellendorffii]|eukprot:XP_002963187.2 serine acetyltransferase 2 [Selaginella moellendorffii]
MALWLGSVGIGSSIVGYRRIAMSPHVRCGAAADPNGSNGAFRARDDQSSFRASRITEQAKDTSLSSFEGSEINAPFGFGQYSHKSAEPQEDKSRASFEGIDKHSPAKDSRSPAVDEEQWKSVFPAYIQSGGGDDHCGDGVVGGEVSAAKAAAESVKELESHVSTPLSAPPCSSAKPPKEGGRNLSELITHDPIWAAIRAEARLEAEKEPLLSSFLYASILAHPCFERSVGFVLANRLKNVTLLATQLLDVFDDVFTHEPQVQEAIRLDVQAVRSRDPSCRSYSSALLYLKGYHALQSYRVAHALWNRGQRVLALALQSRISEVFAVDIHPAARIGKAIMLDHGTGVVIGETCVIGDRVSLMQGVTLGGSGKEAGDRHPKIEEGVLIGAGATILGNIRIGRCSMVAAGSLVLKDVPPHSVAAGTPAKVVGTLEEPTPALTMKHDAMSCQISDDSLCEGAGI